MRATTVVAAAVLVATCAVAARVAGAAESLTGSQQVDNVLAGRVQRVGVAPGFEIYTEAGQVPPRIFTKFNRAMWKVIQKIDPWNLPQTLTQWPVKIFYLNRDTLLRLGLQISGCDVRVTCGQSHSRAVFVTLQPGVDRGFSAPFDLTTVTHETAHLFLFRATDYDREMWASTEFPGWSPGLIWLGRWMVGRVNERFGLNPTAPDVSEARFNQILRLAREETFAGWPETVFDPPSSPEWLPYYNTWYGAWQWSMIQPQRDGRDEVRAAIYIAGAVIWDVNVHQPGTNNFFNSAVAGIVAEVEAECARDNVC